MAVDVDPIVDLDVDLRPSSSVHRDHAVKVQGRRWVDVYVAVEVKVGVKVIVEDNVPHRL